MAAFTVEGMHHALVAARLSAEYGIAVRHGCFCAHPYVVRLLGMGEAEVDAYRREVLQGDHRGIPGAVRASAGLGTSGDDIHALLAALSDLAGGAPPPVPYEQDAGHRRLLPGDRRARLAAGGSRGRCRLFAWMIGTAVLPTYDSPVPHQPTTTTRDRRWH